MAQACNTTPVALNDVVPLLGVTIVVDVLANDVEPDGEALSVTSLSTTCDGTVSEDLGLVTLTASCMSQDCVITYRATDERGASSTIATVTVHPPAGSVFADGFEAGATLCWSEEG